MRKNLHRVAVLAAVAAGMLLATVAQAQYGGSYKQPAPLYPYAVQGDQPYAVEVAPNTYMIQRPAATRGYPYVRCQNCGRGANNSASEQSAPASDRPRKPADRALIEELRLRVQNKNNRNVINTTKIVRDPPVVVETKRYVDDPPRIIERRHIVEDAPVASRRKQAVIEDSDSDKPAAAHDGKTRVIQADAEITILGPDRMNIRLFRKGHSAKAKARAD